MSLVSPVTGRSTVRPVAQIASSHIIELYRRELSVDVSRFFIGVDHVGLYECGDTGYRFYSPFSLAGDESLYESLQALPWYYSEGKSEHVEVLAALDRGESVLEVGCGNGIFLDSLRDKGIEAVGLEFSPAAIAKAVCRGHRVTKMVVEEFAQSHAATFDAVVTFQVLEHVTDVRSFLEGCLKVLKPGGLLAISVPNNEAPYHSRHEDPLNMPPHHMGLWGPTSLTALQRFFPLLLERIACDASTPPTWLHQYVTTKAQQRLQERLSFLGRLAAFLGGPFIRYGASMVSEFIPGQTVTAFFRKT